MSFSPTSYPYLLDSQKALSQLQIYCQIVHITFLGLDIAVDCSALFLMNL